MALRRSATETRQLLIDTGVAMLHERGVTAGVTHIRLQDVLRRAELTTGAAYRLWSDQEAFTAALAALGEGFALQAIEGEPHPMVDVVDGHGEMQHWTLFGLTVQALVDAFTEATDVGGG